MRFLLLSVIIIFALSILGCAISSWVMNNLWEDDENEN